MLGVSANRLPRSEHSGLAHAIAIATRAVEEELSVERVGRVMAPAASCDPLENALLAKEREVSVVFQNAENVVGLGFFGRRSTRLVGSVVEVVILRSNAVDATGQVAGILIKASLQIGMF